ncbi:MAG: AAA family ATPase [Clostridium sp.]
MRSSRSSKTAISSKVMILTGGPGTGKTTTTLGIISAYKRPVIRSFCSSTGRAAKRMAEATGMEAKHSPVLNTSHRKDTRKWGQPLEGDVLILDECSMVISCLCTTFKSIPEHMSVFSW